MNAERQAAPAAFKPRVRIPIAADEDVDPITPTSAQPATAPTPAPTPLPGERVDSSAEPTAAAESAAQGQSEGSTMAPPTAAPTPTQPVPPAAPAHTVETEAQSPAANTAPRPPRARPEPEIQTNIGLKYPVRDLLDRIGMVEGRNIKTVVAAAILEYAKNHGID